LQRRLVGVAGHEVIGNWQLQLATVDSSSVSGVVGQGAESTS
jgi:hypothetical protein